MKPDEEKARERTFGGYSYEVTLAYFIYAKNHPDQIMGSGETCGEWFARCHEITGAEFNKIKRARELAKKD